MAAECKLVHPRELCIYKTGLGYWLGFHASFLFREVFGMAISGISQSSVTKMGKNENVNTEVLVRICLALNCDIGDIAEIILPESQQA